MKIVKISASFSKKIQIRQYEPVEVFQAVEAEVSNDPVEDLVGIQKALFQMAKTAVEEETARLLTEAKEEARKKVEASNHNVEESNSEVSEDLPF